MEIRHLLINLPQITGEQQRLPCRAIQTKLFTQGERPAMSRRRRSRSSSFNPRPVLRYQGDDWISIDALQQRFIFILRMPATYTTDRNETPFGKSFCEGRATLY